MTIREISSVEIEGIWSSKREAGRSLKSWQYDVMLNKNRRIRLLFKGDRVIRVADVMSLPLGKCGNT